MKAEKLVVCVKIAPQYTAENNDKNRGILEPDHPSAQTDAGIL
jgi:hypothetical protein